MSSNGSIVSGNSGHVEGSVASPSINSMSYAIPVSDDIIANLSEESTSEDVSDASEGSGGKNGDNSESERDDLLNDETLDKIINNSNINVFESSDAVSTSEPLLMDVSKCIFGLLKQSLDAADFSESLSLQTKTSATVNAKTLELKQLVDSASQTLIRLKQRFETGKETAKRIQRNLNSARSSIDILNGRLRTDHPIEFSQSRDKAMNGHNA
ncbi:hypothetical protein TPHA_0J02350 [Tetrapisispora phaffii CBS 4417]|uniref:Biogenesis of lysosome-related organelles complex 1 subunit KXD1 n=1 Tax=Tetrapisispora phaffii (strain ATCC 24235 / CBS 4417 / NBRC 1672 / NRRL Y-8282 / UCD 70-5) TaxID=1071381 RepID=G8BYW3_TETPH|nr:hypothetical protein TPHA_0J02350 [Tetrapisispora phaffii CBS 4417]CCE65055.1 hypothetical protein TPHA_0J02350 [Tetrapisispora phaffii CBS 4417]